MTTRHPRLILASRSPRRQEALSALGIPFDTAVSDVEERLPGPSEPTDPVPVALAKAEDIGHQRRERPILAGDTVVVVDGTSLGKPRSPEHAAEMLRELRGREHEVRSAVALLDHGRLLASQVTCPLAMRPFSERQIQEYVASGEPLDCAGAYDVHRLGGALVAEVRGCFATVVGLPIVQVAAVLRQSGWPAPPSQGEAAAACSALYGRPCRAEDPATASMCLAAVTELPLTVRSRGAQ